ncbi:MAG TPA: CvpA family protein [Terriglobales bacterium]|nr:CvpA family protein [Terriglobales bacterium]
MVAVLDILSVAVLALCAVSAARRGFFKTMVGFVGTFAALGAAVVFGGAAGDWLSARWIEKAFEGAVGDYLTRFVTTGEGTPSFTAQLEKLFSSMPDVLREFLGRYSVTAADVQNVIASATGDEAKAAVQAAIATPLASAVSAAAGFVLVFALALVVVRIATFVVDAVLKLPVLKPLNGGMGILLGILEGAVIMMVLAGVLTYLAPFISSYIGRELNSEVINSTILFKYFYQLTPFKRIL